MGKKVKIGKQRKDKFYHLAKEAGYRSRAAFKLIQLNRKFEFLQRSRVLVDLCAAPGGWMQVAQKYMPVSSVVVGVDLVPIKPIANCITLQEDITTAKCRQTLRKELKTWKVDVFLHDGAPNVGRSWVHDAFAQAQLTLHALKLASEFLVRGGWFVTKVFRSKDYHALLWVFNKLFKKVHATKPQASRHESAEIFVVCQHFIAPDKLDPKFLDPAYVFEEAEKEENERPTLGQNDKKKPKAEGYPEGDNTLFHRVAASDFITSGNHIKLLNDNTEIQVDAEEILKHPATTREVLACCKDLKVLGKNELKVLLNWRKKLKPLLLKNKGNAETATDKDPLGDEVVIEETEEDVVDRQISEAKAAEARELRQKKKKVAKERRKLREKMDLKMNLGSDDLMLEDDMELFRLGRLKNKYQLNSVQDQDASMVLSEDEITDDDVIDPRKRKWLRYDKEEPSADWNVYDETDGKKSSDDESSTKLDQLSDIEDEDETDEEEPQMEEDDRNPLIVELDDNTKRSLADRWFDRQEFANLEDDSDEDLEVEMMADTFEKQNKNAPGVKAKDDIFGTEEFEALLPNAKKRVRFETGSDDDDGPVMQKPTEKRKKNKRIRLDPEGLALGTLMIQSSKTKRDIVDSAYNRYANNDENLPDWFVRDEEKHNKKSVPVTAEMMREYRDRLKEINARPIKKIVEAKARKNKRALRSMEKARKRAEAVTESLDMSLSEKAQQIKSIYKRATSRTKKEKEVTYVVAKKGVGKRVRRPPGVKGRFKVVDKRLKKDDRKRKNTEKMARKTGKGNKTKKNSGNNRRGNKVSEKRGKRK